MIAGVGLRRHEPHPDVEVELRGSIERPGRSPDPHRRRRSATARTSSSTIGYVLDGNGTLLYSLAPQGVVHGDRFHIGDLDPDRPGLEGYGVQQDNPSGLLDYYLRRGDGPDPAHGISAAIEDTGRGIAADIDAAHRGYEYWSFSRHLQLRDHRAAQVDTQLTESRTARGPTSASGGTATCSAKT